MDASFTLTERFELDGDYTWRLKDSEIRFRGSGRFTQLVDRRIPVSNEQIQAFHEALNLLDIWTWRNNYDPQDVGLVTMDGSAWSFAAAIGGKQCQCGGENGYPAYSDVELTTTDRGRYAMLLAAMYSCFAIETYIRIAGHQRQKALENNP